jgi:hypothetical protein
VKGAAALPARPLLGDRTITRRFRALGIDDFAGAARWLQHLPYGRTSRRDDATLVLTEGHGTCSSKHALLALLAGEQGIDVALTLGIYEMSERNTPGVGGVLARHGLASLPEAHCYLTYAGERVDITRDVRGNGPVEPFLYEEAIRVDQIGAYKVELHRRVLADWIARSPAARGRTVDHVWKIREACIAALTAVTRPRRATPASAPPAGRGATSSTGRRGTTPARSTPRR